MNFYEFISFAKLFSLAYGGSNITLTEEEGEVVSEILKRMSDDRMDWTSQQRDLYKGMVDFAKEYSKGQQHGQME